MEDFLNMPCISVRTFSYVIYNNIKLIHTNGRGNGDNFQAGRLENCEMLKRVEV